ncbi:class I SAM-dependent methyltransferase [Leptodesmis sichuanensis]|uniref:class I SAM-dependent methyltransferase n=1 Tax=Leptodesmis sichuanensis TaxID=2906798 RepID=UPI001F3F6262|nr:class I SAM-dependent methyltransferase [Leptodesmis sichuanensis]UIE38657.1 class I SAM-dependent methyltransferase [Leptodesmis sichuanensis A121]
MQNLYSLENAQKFNWSSISGNLNPERISHLENYVVGKRILDAGCGGGAYVEFLAQKGFEVTGIDKYEEFLQVAREQGRLGTYVQGDIISLPFPDKAFDCTYCFDVLEHVNDELAIKELARVTSKRLIIAVPRKDEIMHQFGLTFYPYRDPTHLRYYTEDSLRQLALATNCSKLEVIPEGFIPFHSLFMEMLDPDYSKLPGSALRSAYKVKLSNSLLNRFLAKLIDFLLNQLLDFNEPKNLLANGFSRYEVYKKINTGLAIVIDL